MRDRILAGEELLGTFIKTPAPQVVECLERGGLDFAVADMEHAPLDWTTMDLMALASAAVRLPLFFRSRGADLQDISPGLDLGCEGVMVPHISSGEMATQCAEAVRYRRGKRGFSPSVRAGGYGTRGAQLREKGDSEAVIIAQIEDASAIEQLDAISAEADLDVLFLGPADLRLSLELKGGCSPRTDQIDIAKEKVVRGARSTGKAAGIFLSDMADWPRHRELGFTLGVIGSDQQSLRAGAAEIMRGKTVERIKS